MSGPSNVWAKALMFRLPKQEPIRLPDLLVQAKTTEERMSCISVLCGNCRGDMMKLCQVAESVKPTRYTCPHCKKDSLISRLMDEVLISPG